jgi:putative transposon-encoded protein
MEKVILMRKVDFVNRTILKVENIEGFVVRKVTKFGNGAKVDCPKEYLGKTVYF